MSDNKTHNHICLICQCGYYACNSCDKNKGWKSITCTAHHYQIYMVVYEYRNKITSKQEAIDSFSYIDITYDKINDYKNFKETIFETMKEILTPEIVEVKKQSKVIHKEKKKLTD